MEEIIDIYDAQGCLTGSTCSKLYAHQNGLWHASAHVWIYDSNSRVLMQKRSATKETFPSMWDISVAGHIDAGESPMEGAIREIREEIGLSVCPEDLEYITTIRMEYPYPKYGWINREHCHVYLMKLDIDPTTLSLQDEEVEDVRYFTIDEFDDMTKADRGVAVPHERYYEEIRTAIVKKQI